MSLLTYSGGIITPVYHYPSRGVQTQKFWEVDFDLWVGGRGQDMNQQLEGGFESFRQIHGKK